MAADDPDVKCEKKASLLPERLSFYLFLQGRGTSGLSVADSIRGAARTSALKWADGFWAVCHPGELRNADVTRWICRYCPQWRSSRRPARHSIFPHSCSGSVHTELQDRFRDPVSDGCLVPIKTIFRHTIPAHCPRPVAAGGDHLNPPRRAPFSAFRRQGGSHGAALFHPQRLQTRGGLCRPAVSGCHAQLIWQLLPMLCGLCRESKIEKMIPPTVRRDHCLEEIRR